MLDEFNLPKDGPHYRRLVEGFKRIFTSTVYFGTESAGDHHEVWDNRRFHFFDRMRIWCTHEADDDPAAARPNDNVISLSESFWQEVQAHPIPVNNLVIRELTPVPGCLDLYMWLCWRCFMRSEPKAFLLFVSAGLPMQLGVVDYSRDRNFRKRLREWLKLILLYWPDCPARLTSDGLPLAVGASRVID